MDFREESLLKKSNKWSAISAIATLIVAFTTIIIGYFSYQVSERSVQIAEDAKNLVELNNIQDLFTRVQDEALTERNSWANAVIESFYDKFIIDLDLSQEKLEEISRILFSAKLDCRLLNFKNGYNEFEENMIKRYYDEFATPVNSKMHFENLRQSIDYKLAFGISMHQLAKYTKSSDELIRKILKFFISFQDYSLMMKLFSGEEYLKNGYVKELYDCLEEYYGNDLDNEKRRNEDLRKERMEYKEYFKKYSKSGVKIYAIELKKYWNARNNRKK